MGLVVWATDAPAALTAATDAVAPATTTAAITELTRRNLPPVRVIAGYTISKSSCLLSNLCPVNNSTKHPSILGIVYRLDRVSRRRSRPERGPMLGHWRHELARDATARGWAPGRGGAVRGPARPRGARASRQAARGRGLRDGPAAGHGPAGRLP